MSQLPGPFGGPQPVRMARRVGWIIAGALIAAFGLLVTVIGGVVMFASAISATVDPTAEAHTPDVIAFDATEGPYDLFAVHERLGGNGNAAAYTCLVTLADGSTRTLDGSVQAVGTDVGASESIGSFDAVDGPTTVACDAGRDGEKYVVVGASRWRTAGLIVTLVGVVTLLGGAGLLVLGVFRKRPVPA